jgi:tRNA-splicing ligase RtcB
MRPIMERRSGCTSALPNRPDQDTGRTPCVATGIGSLRGDTRIPLLNGTQQSVKDLARDKSRFWVYSVDKERRLVPGLATALQTRSDVRLVRVTVSGGDEVICTPDHLFMMNDGSYRQAQELRFNDSLIPLYRRWQTRDGYESVSTGKGTARLTHNLVYEAMFGLAPPGCVVHHRNHVHFDNSPDNLELLDASTHSRHHRTARPLFDNSSAEFQERRIAGIRRANTDPARQQQMADVGSRNIIRYMTERPKHFQDSVADNGRRGAPHLLLFNTSPRTCDDCGHEAPNPASLRWHKKREHGYNHKVVAVASLRDRSDAYCLQVGKYQNFALAAGVFVHNCGIAAPERT